MPSIDIGANTRAAQREIKDLSKALDDTADALDDVARDSTKAADKVEASFRDMVRASEKVDDSVSRIGDSSRKSFDKAKEGAEEFKDEANSTAREAAASFDGSAESIGDAFQEIAANAFAGFGPAGAVAGLAAAAGIGLAAAGFEQMNEAEEESRERAAEWADAYIAAGSRILSSSQLIARTNEIITDPEKFKEASESAKKWGVSVETAVLAYAGQEASLEAVNAAVEKQKDAYSDLKDELVLGTDAEVKATQALTDSVGALDKLNKAMNDGQIQSSVYSQALRDIADHTEGATKTVDEFGDTVATLPDGTVIYIDAETKQATTNVDAIEQKVYGIKDKNVNITATTSVDTSEYDRVVRKISNTVLKVGTKVVTSGGEWQ